MSNKRVEKLDQIPKNNPFEVPDGYFDRLPGVIQSRLAKPERSPVTWTMALRYAVPVVVIAVAATIWYSTRPATPVDINTELASIQPDQLAVYLTDHDITTEELVESVSWDANDLEDLEHSVYKGYDMNHNQVQDLLDEYDEL